MVLAEAADIKGASCYPSHATVAARAELSERCVWQAMANLQAARLITRQARRDKRGHRTSDLITIQLGRQLAAPAIRDAEPLTAQDAVRTHTDQPAADATREGECLTANDAPPTRTSCKSLTAPGAEEPVRSEPVSEPVRNKRASRLPAVCPTEVQIIEAQDRFNGLGLVIDARLEAEGFRNHHLAKGTKSESWAHNWATWRANAIKWNRQRTAPHAGSGRRSAMGWALNGDPE